MTETMTVEEYHDYLRGGKCKLPGPDATEAVWQANVEQEFRKNGWLVYHARKPKRDTAGFPDLVATHPIWHRTVIAELKTKGRRVTPEQEAWLESFTLSGFVVYTWRFPEHWNHVERVARGGEQN